MIGMRQNLLKAIEALGIVRLYTDEESDSMVNMKDVEKMRVEFH